MSLGIDVTSISSWRDRLQRAPAIRGAAFTTPEQQWCGDDPRRFAVVWALKEATVKLLGTGFAGIGWRGVSVQPAHDLASVHVRLAAHAPARQPRGQVGVAPRAPAHLATDGDRVLVVLASQPVAAATACVPVPLPTRRAGRADRSRQAARYAAQLAAHHLHPGRALALRTGTSGAPRAAWPDGRPAAVSLAHDAGLACAAVALAPHEESIIGISSLELTFSVADGLLLDNCSQQFMPMQR